MTLTNLDIEISEVGTGSQTDFNFGFKISGESDIQVYKVVTATGVATLQTITTDYTVAINTTSDGGVVSYVVDPLATETSFIRRAMARTQATDFPVVGAISELQIEGEFDKRAMIDIENDFGIPVNERYFAVDSTGGAPLLVTADVSVATVFELEPLGAFTLENPTNPPTAFDKTAEIVYMIRFPNTGDRLMTLGSKFIVSPNVAASAAALSALLSDTINLTDYLTARYNPRDDQWIVTSFVNGI